MDVLKYSVVSIVAILLLAGFGIVTGAQLSIIPLLIAGVGFGIVWYVLDFTGMVNKYIQPYIGAAVAYLLAYVPATLPVTGFFVANKIPVQMGSAEGWILSFVGSTLIVGTVLVLGIEATDKLRMYKKK